MGKLIYPEAGNSTFGPHKLPTSAYHPHGRLALVPPTARQFPSETRIGTAHPYLPEALDIDV